MPGSNFLQLRRRPPRGQTLYETRSRAADAAARPLAMAGIHEAVHQVVEQLPRGSLLDVGAGEGAFSLWAARHGFDVTAIDAAPEHFRGGPIRCLDADLGQRWPIEDAQFDSVVAIEVIEHVENHYHFLRECCRVVKPHGRIVISTPNCHSLESRMNYLLTSYDDCAPRPIDHLRTDPYMAHIHPLPFPTLEFGLRHCGFEIEQVTFNRRRKSATLMLPLLYPFVWWRSYRQLVLRERKQHLKRHNRRLLKLAISPRLLTGRVAVYTCRRAASAA